ncbi:hypothetical protein [Streptomyces sp. NBC_01264]|uniref:hypothetical protein n=1 Tax=Streptomyces sp. NBC_01264 TaxID=2903804 RepID=UPI0022511751|nr:hypothetical protein [Streptomyces sp. NBC_01264]MCX4781771.1 hypothetical protein [Streptomyces sp. NBC_01264]
MIRHDVFQQDMLRMAPPDENEFRLARAVVASRSRDAADCETLLGMLGLLPGPEADEPEAQTPLLHLLPPLLDGRREKGW